MKILKFTTLLFLMVSAIETGYGQPNVEGQWSNDILWTGDFIGDPDGVIPVAAALLPDGKVLCWSAYEPWTFGGDNGQTYTVIFDPINETFEEGFISATKHDMFCPGIHNLADGRIMVHGGSSSNKTSIYDPVKEAWEASGALNIARGYHGAVTLPDGRAFTIGGSWSGTKPLTTNGENFGFFQRHGEVWSPITQNWRVLPGVPFDLLVTEGLVDQEDIALSDPGNGIYDYYRGDNHAWLWVAPNGKVFQAGPGEQMHWIDVDANNGEGSYTAAGTRNGETYSMCGVTAMYDIGKIIKAGGAATYEDRVSPLTPANKNCYVIDINNETPVVTDIPDMDYERTFLNIVVIPTGESIVFGGTDNAKTFADDGAYEPNGTTPRNLVPEMYDPESNSWTKLDPMQINRTYHSVAILLPDGRIMTGGGGLDGQGSAVNHPNVELFSPPYLFDENGQAASRPTIDACPLTARYNSNMVVKTGCSVASFVFMRYSSVTHSTNNEQRRIPLTFKTVDVNTYEINVPNSYLLPPGYYMLFAIDHAGVPSVSKRILVDNSPSLATIPEGFCEIAPSGWTLANSGTISEETYDYWDEPAVHAFDGDPLTTWSTETYSTLSEAQRTLEIDMGSGHDLVGFQYIPRQDKEYRGMVREYEFQVSTNGTTWTTAATGEFSAQKAFQTIPFNTTYANHRYFRFIGKSNLFDDDFPGHLEDYVPDPAVTVPSDITYQANNFSNHVLQPNGDSDETQHMISVGEIIPLTNQCTPALTAQTITFNAIPDKNTTDIPFAISATSSSGLTVTLSLIDGPATLENGTVTLTGLSGTVTIQADQAGNGTYESAPSVVQTFVVQDANTACRTLDLGATAFVDYGTLTNSGLAEVTDDGNNVWLINDNSRSISISQTVTATTVLAFEFAADQEGLYHGIGLDNNAAENGGDKAIMLYGTNTGKFSADNETYNNYDGNGGYKQYVIPIGSLGAQFLGSMNRLFFISEIGTSGAVGSSNFRNIRIYDSVTDACSEFQETIVRIKMNLQGPWNTDDLDMNNTLMLNDQVPLTQQYSGAPWNYAGSECIADFPADCVDWVMVNLRAPVPNDGSTILYQKVCLLKKDGTVVDPSGSENINFGRTGQSQGFISVHHRNHLGVMTELLDLY